MLLYNVPLFSNVTELLESIARRRGKLRKLQLGKKHLRDRRRAGEKRAREDAVGEKDQAE